LIGATVMAENILFITGTRIGDAILSSGLLAHLVDAYPDARFTVACGAPAAPLFRTVPRLDKLVVIRKKPFKTHWLSLWLACIGRPWTLVVDLRRSGLSWMLWARHRHIKGAAIPGLHRVEEDATALGLDPAPDPRIWVDDAAEAEAAAVIPAGRAVLAIGPTANWGAKEWRAEHFAALVDRLTGPDGILPDAMVALMGGPDERERARILLDAIPDDRLIDLFGQPLPAAYATMKRCALYIGNDSGLMHLSAASGAPTLGLFGPSPEQRYRPWGKNAAVARTPESHAELVGAPDFDHRNQATLMDSLTVEAAVQAAEDLWRRCAS
jgi:heptosyltransferase III